jgi:hypothetical protein
MADKKLNTSLGTIFLVMYQTMSDDSLFPLKTYYAAFQKKLDAICFIDDQLKKNDNYGTPECIPIKLYQANSYAYNFEVLK